MTQRPPVAIIIPAFNEGPRVAEVVTAACKARFARRVLVVDDCSKDDTWQAANQAGAEVLRLPANVGKARAMHAGVKHVKEEDYVLFLDADLHDLLPEQIDTLIVPVLRGAKMSVGGFVGVHLGNNQIAPVLSGQRCMRRTTWMYMAGVDRKMVHSRFGVEMVLDTMANLHGWEVVVVPLRGVWQTTKEQKMGLAAGLKAKVKMYRDAYVSLYRSSEQQVGPALFDWIGRGGYRNVKHVRGVQRG